MRLRLAIVPALLLVALVAPGRAAACSHDDATYYETFLDTSCLQLPLANTTLDALGGIRLTTNGTPVATAWDTDTDFDNGINFQATLFPPLGVGTLQRTGTGTAASLQLPPTLLPLVPDSADPVLRPTAATVLDNDNVDDPTLVKVGSTYYLWYTGTPEDGGRSAIFLATSSDGTAWTRANGGAPVLLRNDAGHGNHWLGVKLQSTSCNRDAVGATITWSSNGMRRSRFKSNGGSYLSSHDMREVLGLGSATKVEWVEIKWPPPSGRVERFVDLPIDRYVTIVEGKGEIS